MRARRVNKGKCVLKILQTLIPEPEFWRKHTGLCLNTCQRSNGSSKTNNQSWIHVISECAASCRGSIERLLYKILQPLERII